MSRRYHPPPGLVHVSTMLLASYHVEYLMAECRLIRMPILYNHFMASKTASGASPQLDRSSNGVSSNTLVLRERDLIEFMLRWGEFVSGVAYHSPTDEFCFKSVQQIDYVVDLPGMEPYRERFRKHWRM